MTNILQIPPEESAENVIYSEIRNKYSILSP